MKKYGLICLLLILCVVWIGCSQAKPTPSEPSETEPSVAEPPVTEPTEPDEPTDDGPGIGGAEQMSLECEYDYHENFYGLSTSLAKLVDAEKLDQWFGTFDNEDGTRNYDGINILSFIEKFNISKDVLVEKNNAFPYPMFSNEQIEALYSKDPKQLADCFANPYAIRVGDEIYPAKWVVEHTVEEIAEAGITLEELTAKCAEWQKFGTLVTDIPARAQAKLAEYKAYVENKQ